MGNRRARRRHGIPVRRAFLGFHGANIGCWGLRFRDATARRDFHRAENSSGMFRFIKQRIRRTRPRPLELELQEEGWLPSVVVLVAMRCATARTT